MNIKHYFIGYFLGLLLLSNPVVPECGAFDQEAMEQYIEYVNSIFSHESIDDIILLYLCTKMEKSEITQEELQSILNRWKKEKGSLKEFPLHIFVGRRSDLLKNVLEMNKDFNLDHYVSCNVDDDKDKITALYNAIDVGDIASAEYLLQAGASPEEGFKSNFKQNLLNSFEQKPIERAYQKKDKESIELLSKYDADFSIIKNKAQKDYDNNCSWLNSFSSECRDARGMKAFIEELIRKREA